MRKLSGGTKDAEAESPIYRAMVCTPSVLCTCVRVRSLWRRGVALAAAGQPLTLVPRYLTKSISSAPSLGNLEPA